MAITQVSSAIFSQVDRSEVDAFRVEARRILEIEEKDGEASLDAQAQLKSLHLKGDEPFIHYVKGNYEGDPTYVHSHLHEDEESSRHVCRGAQHLQKTTASQGIPFRRRGKPE